MPMLVKMLKRLDYDSLGVFSTEAWDHSYMAIFYDEMS